MGRVLSNCVDIRNEDVKMFTRNRIYTDLISFHRYKYNHVLTSCKSEKNASSTGLVLHTFFFDISGFESSIIFSLRPDDEGRTKLGSIKESSEPKSISLILRIGLFNKY